MTLKLTSFQETILKSASCEGLVYVGSKPASEIQQLIDQGYLEPSDHHKNCCRLAVKQPDEQSTAQA